MNGMDLFCALNTVEDSFVKETLTYTEKTKRRKGVYKSILGLAAVLVLMLVCNKFIYQQFQSEYRVVSRGWIFQPIDDYQKGYRIQDWDKLLINERYARVVGQNGYFVSNGNVCAEEDVGELLGVFCAKGKEYKRVGILFYIDIEILHETEVKVFEVVGKDSNDTVAVKFPKIEGYYLYEKGN